jgi:hypothetical protein
MFCAIFVDIRYSKSAKAPIVERVDGVSVDLAFDDDEVSDRTVQSKRNDLLVRGRSVPSFSSLSRRELDDDETRVRPFPFQ